MATQERPVILVIDDEPGILECFALIFEPDYEVLRAPNGSTAMAILQSRPVDLILLDLGLPDINGLVLLRQIRTVDAKIPVIVVTIIDRARTALDALRLGADDYVTKPFEEEDLLLRVRGLLSELGLRSPRILLLEPDLGVRATITVALERECLVTAVASPGVAAHELGSWMPDLVIVDAKAAAGDDTGLLMTLRRQFPDLPMIFVTDDFHTLLAGIAAHLPTVPELPSLRRFGRRTASLIQRIAPPGALTAGGGDRSGGGRGSSLLAWMPIVTDSGWYLCCVVSGMDEATITGDIGK